MDESFVLYSFFIVSKLFNPFLQYLHPPLAFSLWSINSSNRNKHISSPSSNFVCVRPQMSAACQRLLFLKFC